MAFAIASPLIREVIVISFFFFHHDAISMPSFVVVWRRHVVVGENVANRFVV
jgi:hypothetical protein